MHIGLQIKMKESVIKLDWINAPYFILEMIGITWKISQYDAQCK